ncbi:hypothetical protein ABZ079_27605 [Streptomyces sp. NPDC006314]|uniref:hypothetical protein n=1 Tax=Streptomyces sp. NPDC006314 TaxID=3154475 RepID=UPI0033AD9B40
MSAIVAPLAALMLLTPAAAQADEIHGQDASQVPDLARDLIAYCQKNAVNCQFRPYGNDPQTFDAAPEVVSEKKYNCSGTQNLSAKYSVSRKLGGSYTVTTGVTLGGEMGAEDFGASVKSSIQAKYEEARSWNWETNVTQELTATIEPRKAGFVKAVKHMKSVEGSLFVKRYNDSGIGYDYHLLDHILAVMQEREPSLVADEAPMTPDEIQKYCSTAP